MNVDAPSDGFISLPFVKKKVNTNIGVSVNPETRRKELRLPLFGHIPNRVRNHIIAMIGEFVGTWCFLFFAFAGTQVANAAATAENASSANSSSNNASGSLAQAPNAGTLLYISLCFGFSLAINAWVFFRITGGLFNPAVTLGMALIGAVPWIRAGLVFISQILGAMAASAVVSALFPGPLNVATTLGGETSVVRGLFIEMFLTAMLVFTIFMLAAEKHKGTFLAPVGIGLALFIAELAGVYFTGGSLNPARSFGPCVVLHHFPGYHWLYWVGPALGALVAVGFYRLVKTLEYETANPGQDNNEHEAEVFNEEYDEDHAATGADVARPSPGAVQSVGSWGSGAGSGTPSPRQGISFANLDDAVSGMNPTSSVDRSATAESGAATSAAAATGEKNATTDAEKSYDAAPVAEAGLIGAGNNRVSGESTLAEEQNRSGGPAKQQQGHRAESGPLSPSAASTPVQPTAMMATPGLNGNGGSGRTLSPVMEKKANEDEKES